MKLIQSLRFFTSLTFATLSIGSHANVSLSGAPPVSVSYVQNATSATLIPGAGNLYTLRLKNVTPFVLYFSDRPNRAIGQMKNALFLQKWQQGQNSFKNDAPNAELNGLILDKHHHTQFSNFVVELAAPNYDAKHGTFNYQAVLLTPPENNQPVLLQHAVLFIDEACLTCVG